VASNQYETPPAKTMRSHGVPRSRNGPSATARISAVIVIQGMPSIPDANAFAGDNQSPNGSACNGSTR
jgi:hypothetical protein